MQEPIASNNSINTDKGDLGNLNLRDYFYKYIRFFPLFVVSVIFTLLIAFIYLRYTIPIYNVGGTILIKSEQQSRAKDDKFQELFINDKAQNIQSEMEILKSRPLMQRVVEGLNLQFSYYTKGKIKKTINIYKQTPFHIEAARINDLNRSFSIKIKFLNEDEFRVNDGMTASFGKNFKTADGEFKLLKNPGNITNNEYRIEWQPVVAASKEFAGMIVVASKNLATGILNISMRTTNPYLGADIINKLMEEYGQYSIEQKKQSSDQILQFIDDRLFDYGRRVDSVQKIRLAYQVKNNIINAEAQSNDYFTSISEAGKAANEQTIRLSIAGMLEDYLADKKNEFAKVIVPSSLGLADVTLNQLISTYNQSQMERQRLLNGSVPVDNPFVKELAGQIEKLRINIRENLRNIKLSLNNELGNSQRRGNVSESQLKEMPVKVNELAEISRQAETYLALFKYLQEKREETAISRASTISNSNIIDMAYPSKTPVAPNRKAVWLIAILLGIGIPALFLFIREMLNDKIVSRVDVEKLTVASILGEIGHSYTENVLVATKTNRSMVAEQFRIVRSNLQYVIGKKEKVVILVTSSFSGEGKSYISTNMGAVLALAGKKVIILEFDIRKPKLLSGLDLPKSPGISNYMVGKAELSDLIIPVPGQENLFVLGCGPVPPNPAELLLDSKVEVMFKWLRENFDAIIIDTAPAGMVSDALSLGKFADCTLYLVRQGYTLKRQVGLIDEFYKNNKLPKLSIIINDVKMASGYGYYGYGRYGYGPSYGYGYGGYYEQERKPVTFIKKVWGMFGFHNLFRKKVKKK